MQKITIPIGQKIWFTSDNHFNHKRILQWANRPFKTLEEMHETMIFNWNEVVNSNDYIFVLGDMFWDNKNNIIRETISKLNGIKFLIPGNHDKVNLYKNAKITIMRDIVRLHIKEKSLKVWLSHYPLMTYPQINGNSIQLFGHIHSQGKLITEFGKVLPLVVNKQLDVGVDRHNYYPISLDTVLTLLDKQSVKDGYREI